tara:strand:- start:52 stop:336 length:285 start_codon:yes stop_codon:yes gene_type:complete
LDDYDNKDKDMYVDEDGMKFESVDQIHFHKDTYMDVDEKHIPSNYSPHPHQKNLLHNIYVCVFDDNVLEKGDYKDIGKEEDDKVKDMALDTDME